MYWAAQEKNWTIHSAADLMAGKTFTIRTKTGTEMLGFPDATRAHPHPFIGNMDMTPHVIEPADNIIFIPGIQTDRSTESLRNINPKDPHRTTLTKHIDEIISFHKSKLFQSHYGFTSAMYPIVVIDESHAHNALNYIHERVGPCGYILVKVFPDIAFLDHFLPLTGEMFLTPWRRAGRPDFVFA
jgi:hypothetical protein